MTKIPIKTMFGIMPPIKQTLTRVAEIYGCKRLFLEPDWLLRKRCLASRYQCYQPAIDVKFTMFERLFLILLKCVDRFVLEFKDAYPPPVR